MQCMICGHSDWRARRDVDHVIRTAFSGSRVQQCRKCGFAQLAPLPTPAVVLEAYRQDYLAEYDRSGESAVINEQTAECQLKDRMEVIEGTLPAKGKLLDVGASRGVFMNHASKRGWQVEGIEMEQEAIDYAKHRFGLAIRRATIESAELPLQTFDVVHASHVLEHVYDPLECIHRMRQWLRPNGLLVLEVPYELGDLESRFVQATLGRETTMNRVPSTHLHFFTLSTLSKLLESCGLEVVLARSLRRNRALDSQFLFGGIVKRFLYQVEQWLCLAPLIEIYAKVPEQD